MVCKWWNVLLNAMQSKVSLLFEAITCSPPFFLHHTPSHLSRNGCAVRILCVYVCVCVVNPSLCKLKETGSYDAALQIVHLSVLHRIKFEWLESVFPGCTFALHHNDSVQGWQFSTTFKCILHIKVLHVPPFWSFWRCPKQSAVCCNVNASLTFDGI